MPNTNLENAKTNMKSRIRNRAAISSTPRDLGRLAKSARFVGLIDDSEVETELDTQMASAIPSASIDDLVSLSEGINELRDRRPALGGMTSTDQMVEGSRKFLHANSVQPAISVSGDLSYENGVVSYTTPTSAALQVVATVGDLPAGASAGDQAVVQSNNKLYIKTAEGWYAVALINTAPSVSGNDASYTLATDGTPTVITLTATDPENDPVTFSHSVTSGDLNGTTVEQNDNVFTVTPHASQNATFELTFSADDSVNVATTTPSSFTLLIAAHVTSGLDMYLDAGTYSGSGTTWTNSASSSFGDATLIGSPTWSSDNGGYFTLNGYTRSDQAAFINVASPVAYNTYTYSVWVYQENPTSSYKTLIDQDNDDHMFSLYSGQLSLYDPSSDSGIYVPQFTWNNLGLTYNGAGEVKFYLNGSEVSSKTTSSPSHTTSNFAFGTGFVGNSSANEPFSGRYAQAMIYNRVLSSEEMMQNFTAFRSRYGI